MKIISSDEIANTKFVGKASKSKNQGIYDALKTVEVGQGFQFGKEEWTGKSHPSITIYATKKLGMKFIVRTLEDKSGWVAIRTK